MDARLIALLIFAAYSAAHAATLTTIHTFTGAPNDGAFPLAGVVIGPGGVLYGTTSWGGTELRGPCQNCGTVFSLTPPTSPGDPWTESFYSFPSPATGDQPNGGVAIGGGVLYGTALDGGDCNHGTVFELNPPESAGASWAETVLLNVCPAEGDPPWKGPSSTPAIGAGGVLYATTDGPPYRATAPSGIGRGTVFSVTPPTSSGGSWTETVLATFTGGSDGGFPNALVVGAGGTLFGTTYGGGVDGCTTSGCGTVYSLTPPNTPGGSWAKTVLHYFTGSGGDGYGPEAAVVIGSGGVLYGTTYGGGGGPSCGTYGCGTVFSLTPAGPGVAGTYEVLYNFPTRGGLAPAGPVVIGRNGVLFGTTIFGGKSLPPECDSGCGTLFSLTPAASPGGAWTETVLYEFTGGSDGGYPVGALAIDSNGVIYGATEYGGSGLVAGGNGTVFSWTP
jgi:uncharacterized repeat protein (TIGR03803 family)